MGGLKRYILRFFGRQPFEDVLFYRKGMIFGTSLLDTRGSNYCRNVAIWYDGTFRPARGHHGNCKWFYDGQFHYHLKHHM